MYDLAAVACCVPDVSVGDVEFNTKQILEYIDKCVQENVDFVVFPEMCITGYTCQDLFFQRRLLDCSNEKIKEIVEYSSTCDLCIMVGAPFENCNRLYNCAFVIFDGKIQAIIPKKYIPNYSEYYEYRWFSPAPEKGTTVLDDIPFGAGTIVDYKGIKFSCEICEDLWAPVPPSSVAAVNGAEIIFNLSASNETIGKDEYRRALVSNQSSRCLCIYCYASAGCEESTQDLIFSGKSIVCENGKITAENDKLIDTDYLLIADVDLGKIRHDRMQNKSFAVSSTNVFTDIKSSGETHSDGSRLKIDKRPFVPSSEKDRFERCMKIFEMQSKGLEKRLKITNAKPVIGVSGGLDSTLALLVCAKALKNLGRKSTDCIALTLPCFGTTKRTHSNAVKLMKALNCTCREIDIKNACTVHCNDIGHPMDEFDVTYENVQARERTQILMDIACECSGLVVGTGDLSELALGWCTYNADHMSMYGVNASIPKTLIKWMISAICEEDIFDGCKEILCDIIDTPISPELLPPDDNGNIAQLTETQVGPYILNDFFLYYFLRYGFTRDKIKFLATKAFSDTYDDETIDKWLNTFIKRFFTQQFKRSCLPDSVKVGSVCLSPRGDWRMPTDASYKSFLK